jgi:hypothetical protein
MMLDSTQDFLSLVKKYLFKKVSDKLCIVVLNDEVLSEIAIRTYFDPDEYANQVTLYDVNPFYNEKHTFTKLDAAIAYIIKVNYNLLYANLTSLQDTNDENI